MNQRCHRLVFSRRRRMLMAVAESASASGKTAGGESAGRGAAGVGPRAGFALCLALLAGLGGWPAAGRAQTAARPAVTFGSADQAARAAAGRPAASLPTPYANAAGKAVRPFAYDPARGTGIDLRDTGAVAWTISPDGRTATFNQGNQARVVLNWDAFDIAAGHQVKFEQSTDTSRYVSALNRIWGADPSLILGRLSANREVILVNGNGVYFGAGAKVDTGKFIASALNIADSVFDKGLRNVTDASGVFSTAADSASGYSANLDAVVSVEAGAEIRSAAGGDVMLIAPRVVNQGRIDASGGQAVLAAGRTVYLASSADPSQRGLIVAVDPILAAGSSTAVDETLGSVENRAAGSSFQGTGSTGALVDKINEIHAASGTVNLVGLLVRQSGRISTSTSVKGENGAVYLQAMAGTAVVDAGLGAQRRGMALESGGKARMGAELGTLAVGAGSQTLALPADSAATQLDAETFNPSRIQLEGKRITIGEGAELRAPSGTLSVLAAARAQLGPAVFDTEPNAMLTGADGSSIDIAANARLSVAGLRDVAVDGSRNQGSARLFRIELADAPVQRDTALYRGEVKFDLRDTAAIKVANLSGAAGAVARSVAEKSADGGQLRIETEGDLRIATGTTLDVAGGSVRYSEAWIAGSLAAIDGRVFDLKSVPAGQRVTDLVDGYRLTNVPAYTEGRDAGTLVLSARTAQSSATYRGDVVVGERQRTATAEQPAGGRFEFGRLVGDTGLYVDRLVLLPEAAVPGLGESILALNDVQRGGFQSLTLRAREIVQRGHSDTGLGEGGALTMLAGRIALDGRFTAPGGAIALKTVLLDSTPASAEDPTGSIRLSAATALDASGRWTNDSAAAGLVDGGSAGGLVQTRGGSISLSAAHSLDLAAGAALDVSGGAWLSASGALSTGRAGSLSLSIGKAVEFPSTISLAGVQLRGFDFAGGGKLSLVTPGLVIGTGTGTGTDRAATDLLLTPDFFASGGFGSISLDAFGALRLASGTVLAPVLQSWEWVLPGYRGVASGAMGSGVVRIATLDEQVGNRPAVSLGLGASGPAGLATGIPSGELVVERGASIRLEAGGNLSLSANRQLSVGAQGGQPGQPSELSAPGGSIELRMTGQRGGVAQDGSDDTVGFLSDQAIWLGAAARLDVSGTAELRPDRSSIAPRDGTAVDLDGRLTGTVLGGGEIRLIANRGHVVAASGSQLRLDGAVSQLALPGLGRAVQVARPAGTLRVSAPEGFVLEGAVSAQPPVDAQGQALAAGGSLDLSVGLGGLSSRTASSRPYPDAASQPRELVLGAAADLLARSQAVPGADLSAVLGNGIGHVPLSLVQDAGFDGLRLGSGDRIVFNGSQTLAAAHHLVLDAPGLAASAGAEVRLSGASVRLGNMAIAVSGRSAEDSSGRSHGAGALTRLTVTAPSIELVGQFGLQGFDNTLLNAADGGGGQIRMMGKDLNLPALDSASTWTPGRLAFDGTLALAAGVSYVTSGASFAIEGVAASSASAPGSTLELRRAWDGSTPQAPLSAFGQLSASATRIDHDGVLHQPLGQISLSAERSLSLGSRSVTSVSAQGLPLLYGSSQNLSAWLQPGSGRTSTQAPLAKGIALRAGHLETAASAVVDASGGGDAQAWEFFPGIGGSSDPFLSDGLYAVLPDHSHTQSQALDGGRLADNAIGQQVVITMAGAGLAPGRYNLLPARYALLANVTRDGRAVLPQGAFLVRRAADQGSSVLQSALHNDDGSTVVTGFLVAAGSSTAGLPGERFTVAPVSTVNAQGEIRLTGVSSLLAGAGTAGALPRDAGLVQVAATRADDRSAWQAQVDLQGHGGVAGQLDMTAPQVNLVADPSASADNGLSVGAGTLSASQAGSVLLGGWRSPRLDAASGRQALNPAGEPVWTIDGRIAAAVDVALPGTQLALQELVLSARQQVSLAAGTQLAAVGPGTQGPRELSASGDGAVLALSANALSLGRSDVGRSTGAIVVADGSALTAAHLLADSTLTLGLASSTALNAGRLSLGARHLVVGDGLAVGAGSTLLGGDLLASVRSAGDLQLRSYSSIDFVGLQDWAGRADGPGGTAAASRVGQRLVLDAPTVRGLSVAGAADSQAAMVDIAAQAVVLRNSSGLADASSGSADSRLTLQAVPGLQVGSTGGLTLGPGAIRLAAADVALRSSGDIVLTGTGSTSASGDLSLAAARLTAAAGALQAIRADSGTLSLGTEAGSRTLGERVGLGAAVALSGRTVHQDGQISLPGGALDITAAGTAADAVAIRFGEASRTSVAGVVLPGHDGFDAAGLAGAISVSASLGHLAAWGTLDVSAAALGNGFFAPGDAGSIRLQAAAGQLQLGSRTALLGRAGGGRHDRGGELQVDVGAMASADTLASQAMAGGLSRSVDLRVRGGDLALDQSLRAGQIRLSADSGRISLGAVTLDARAAAGGVVQISSGGDLSLAAGSRIDARSGRTGANGGDVLLSSTRGLLNLDPSALIQAGGDDAADGRITLRAARAADNSTVNIGGTLNTANLQAGLVDIEAVKTYSTVGSGAAARAITTLAAATNASTGTLGIATIRADAAALAAAAPRLLDGLGVSPAEIGRVALRSGVEVQAGGNLTLSSAWLNTDPENAVAANRRTLEDAGYLTLRAAGNLSLNASLSDGFTTATAAGSLLSSGVSSTSRDWSLRLVAGADLAAASPLAVRDLAGGSSGDLTIAGNQFVRTGAGSLDLAAGRNLVFAAGTGASGFSGQAYVAGRRMTGADAVLDSLFASQTADPLLTEQGGRLGLHARGQITAPEASQLINNWFWRSALESTSAGEAGLYNSGAQLAWWTQFPEFRQTVGSFGGGDVRVQAGGDITNLQVMAPTTAWADSRSMATAQLQIRNGGDVDVQAGGSVLGGQFLVGRGEGRISAGQSIAGNASSNRVQETVLALMDGQWRLAARDSVATTGAFNPTALPVTTARAPQSGFFYTWGEDAAVSLHAAAGSASLTGLTNSARSSQYGLTASPADGARVLAPSLSITAGGGDLQLMAAGQVGGIVLFPDPDSQLQLWAQGQLTQRQGLAMADTDPGAWPSARQPVTNTNVGTALYTGLISATSAGNAAQDGIHRGDAVPVQIHAGADLVTGQLVLPKAAHISVGGDVLQLRLSGQHLSATDRTWLLAGGDIDFGNLGSNTAQVSLGGPGSLALSAGGDVNLGNSAGVVTIGNQRNPGLPEAGASIRISAAAGATVDLATLDAQYLAPVAEGGSVRSDSHRASLVGAVEQALQVSGLSYAQARALFAGFPPASQAAFARQVLAAEFSATYLTGSAPGAAELAATLQAGFDRNKAQVLAAGEAALAAGTALVLPGRASLAGADLRSWLERLRGLADSDLEMASTLAARQQALAQVRDGWKASVATSLGRSVTELEALPAADATAQAYRTALASTSGALFDAYRQTVLRSELVSAGTAASNFGQNALPMRLALFDQGFAAAELAGEGSFVVQPIWQAKAPLLQRGGRLEMTQSSVVTERGGDIALLNPGGAISVGLKEASGAKGVIAMGNGSIFGYARDDILVNTQRIFALGNGDMALWSSVGDIDSGKGANTAVAAPPLTARRSVDGMVYERAATSSGSGLATLGSGTLSLLPAFGEIRALDAFIRAQSVVLASNVRGSDNLFAASVGGQAPTVAAPPPAVGAPGTSGVRAAETVPNASQGAESRVRNSLLTVDLLGLGDAPVDAPAATDCSAADEQAGKCRRPPRPGAAAPASPAAPAAAPATPPTRSP